LAKKFLRLEKVPGKRLVWWCVPESLGKKPDPIYKITKKKRLGACPASRVQSPEFKVQTPVSPKKRKIQCKKISSEKTFI
jgi:hypothetical protein